MNVRFFIILLLLIIVNASVKSQFRGVLKYNFINHDDKLGVKKQERVIYFNNKISIELNGKNFFKEIDKNDETQGSVIIPSKKPYFIYKNFSIKSLSLSEKLGRRDILVIDTLSNFKWKITKEKKKILSYNCTKATTQFRGRNYEAWYSEGIPIQNGPWKFCGLPGLIIKVYDDKQTFVYELTEIDLKAKFDEKIISIPNEYEKDKFITHRQLMILYKKKLEDYAKLSKVVHSSKDGGYGSVTIILPEKMEKF